MKRVTKPIWMAVQEWVNRLKVRLGLMEEVHYINGPETLPAPLTQEEEQVIFRKLQTQDDAKAREPLITHNLRLVVYIAKKFESPNNCVEDLISIGTIGLIKAVNTFCPSRNIKLATYASRCIENEILMYLRKSVQLKNEMSIDEPLNVDWDGNELLFSDVLGSDPDVVNRGIEQQVERDLLLQAVEHLSDREAQIMKLRFGLVRRKGAHPEGGSRSAGHLPILHIPPGKTDHRTAQKGTGAGRITGKIS